VLCCQLHCPVVPARCWSCVRW